MARYLVEFDYVEFGADEFDTDEGEAAYEEYEILATDEIEVEAESEDAARITARDTLRVLNEVLIWNIEKIEG